MNNISARELKKRMDSGEKIMLVNALEENKFRAGHIPGSLNIFTKQAAEQYLEKEDDIVVYCTDYSCNKSILLYQLLEALGYKKIIRFAGGLREWTDCGFEIEVDIV